MTNAGTIRGTGSSGIGVLFSDSFGVFDNTLTNSGTVSGDLAAVRFGDGNDLLRLLPGASFTGRVDGGGGINTLELTAGTGTGTLAGFGTSFTNFGTLLIDKGAQWTFSGNSNDLSSVSIIGFTALDTIDLTNLAFASVSGGFASNALVLTSAAGQDTLHIQGNFSPSDFRFSSDGAGGTDIQLASVLASDSPASAPGLDNPASAPVSEFDRAFYLAHNPDVAAAGIDPFFHYSTYGWKDATLTRFSTPDTILTRTPM